MRLLVTGSSGFIGRHLVTEAREHGHEVIALDRATLADPRRITAAVLTARPDACMHLAWRTDPTDYLASPENVTHLEMGLSLARALQGTNCHRLLVTGTCVEYDISLGYLSERSLLAPDSLYAICKRALFDILTSALRGGPVSLTWPRLFFLYGPGERRGRLVSDVTRQLLDNGVARVGSGEHVRDYIHVVDAARALLHLVEAGLDGPVNIATGKPVTVREIVKLVCASVERHGGRPARIDWGAAVGRTDGAPFVCADVRRLRTSGFTPRLTLADGIDAYVEEEACRKS